MPEDERPAAPGGTGESWNEPDLAEEQGDPEPDSEEEEPPARESEA